MKVAGYYCMHLIALVFAIAGLQPLYAQNLKGHALADSLMNEMPKAKNDTSQVNLFIKAAKALITIDPAAAMHYNDSAMHLAQKYQWKKGIGMAYFNKARINNATSDFAGGVENAGKAYEYFASLNLKAGMADALAQTANNYEPLGNYTKALENNFKALAIYEDAGLDINVAWVFNNIGADYYWLTDYPSAIENYNKGLEYFKKTNNKYGIASAIDNIASVYEDMGDYTKVNAYNLQAVKLFEELNNKPAMGRIYINRGNLLKYQREYDSAIIYYKKAINIAQKLDIKRTLAFGYDGIGEVYFNLAKNGSGNYKIPDSLKAAKPILLRKAHGYFSKALALSESDGDLSLMVQFTALLSETEELLGNYKSALSFYKQSTHYNDSIFNDDNKTKIANLEKERISEIKDKEIQLINKENALRAATQEKKIAEARREKSIQYFMIAALGIIVLAVLIIALIQYRNSRQKQKANALLQQQKEKVERTLTELKSAQAQLIQSEKMASLGALTAGIAHEIQNPLNFVNNFSEVNTELIAEMKNEILANNTETAISIANDIEENEQKINHHGKRADAIVKGMLQHSRTSAGQKELADINALAQQYLELSYKGIRAKNKSLPADQSVFYSDFKENFDESISKIKVVPQDIGRVLLNLYNNALYAVGQKLKTEGKEYKPLVSVSTYQKENSVFITVSDNGDGIPQNVTDKIFQPFFTTKPTGEGTGLGLSLSYDIIKVHGGNISVQTKEGEGSKFIIQLPVV